MQNPMKPIASSRGHPLTFDKIPESCDSVFRGTTASHTRALAVILVRMLLDNLRSMARNLKHEIKVYQLVMKDHRTPKLAKFLLGLAVGYALLPFDIIPDFLPVIGHLDDALIVPALIVIALRMIPKGVVEECRMMAGT
jgi:uncharacterized membrane protein YkvA (DUF1232 family)